MALKVLVDFEDFLEVLTLLMFLARERAGLGTTIWTFS